MPPHRRADIATPALHTSIPQRSYTCSVPQALHTSYVHTSMLPHLHASTSHADNSPPSLLASTSVHQQHASKAPGLHNFMLPRLHTCSPPPAVPASIPPRLEACTLPPSSCTSMSPRLYACNAPAVLHTSKPPRRYACSVPPELHTAMASRR